MAVLRFTLWLLGTGVAVVAGQLLPRPRSPRWLRRLLREVRDGRHPWGPDRDWRPGELRGQQWRPRVVEPGPPRHALWTDTDEFHALIGREFPARVEVR
jgi:hypothetical protein